LKILILIDNIKAINVIESPHLRKIFLLLRKDLTEVEIPGRTRIREHVDKVYKEYLQKLEEELKV
jgi:hypothetical protein